MRGWEGPNSLGQDPLCCGHGQRHKSDPFENESLHWRWQAMILFAQHWSDTLSVSINAHSRPENKQCDYDGVNGGPCFHTFA